MVTTEDALHPVVAEGVGQASREAGEIFRSLALLNRKHSTDYPGSFLDPAVNATIRARPRWGFGLAEGDFTGSPTRSMFDESPA